MMTVHYHSDTAARVEVIEYAPSLQYSGDLEPAVAAITAVARPAAPDYSASLTTPGVPDARIAVRRLCQRLNIHIDNFDGVPAATRLFYSVEVNGVERASGEFASPGADNPVAWDLTPGQFNLGTPNLIEVYLWVDQGSAAVSAVELWQGVGTATTGWSSYPLEVSHEGLVQVSTGYSRVGGGTPGCHLMALGAGLSMSESLQPDISSRLSISAGSFAIRVKGTAATDLNYLSVFCAGLRRPMV